MSSLLSRIKEEKEKAKLRKAEGNEEELSCTASSTHQFPSPPPPSSSSSTFRIPFVDHASITLSREITPISKWKVSDIDNIYYVPNIIDKEVANAMLAYIDSDGLCWTQLKTRKLKCYEKKQSESSMNEESFPSWLDTLCNCLVQNDVYHSSIEPNHVLINRYEEGEGILHHTDGPAYHDQVAIISLGSAAYFSFKRNIPTDMVGIIDGKEDVVKLHLEPESLLIFNGNAYSEYLHGIDADYDPTQMDSNLYDNKSFLSLDNIQFSSRTSLTIRRIIK